MSIMIIRDLPFCLFPFRFSWRQDAITDVPGVVDQVKGLYNMYKILICQGEVSLKSMAVHGMVFFFQIGVFR